MKWLNGMVRGTQAARVWVVLERYEDHGTDVSTIHTVWATEERAKAAQEQEEREHDWECKDCDGEGGVWDEECKAAGHEEDRSEWCLCCRQDWKVESMEVFS